MDVSSKLRAVIGIPVAAGENNAHQHLTPGQPVLCALWVTPSSASPIHRPPHATACQYHFTANINTHHDQQQHHQHPRSATSRSMAYFVPVLLQWPCYDMLVNLPWLHLGVHLPGLVCTCSHAYAGRLCSLPLACFQIAQQVAPFNNCVSGQCMCGIVCQACPAGSDMCCTCISVCWQDGLAGRRQPFQYVPLLRLTCCRCMLRSAGTSWRRWQPLLSRICTRCSVMKQPS